MKKLALAVSLVSVSTFANTNVQCWSQYKDVVAAFQADHKNAISAADQGILNAQFTIGSGDELIVQSDRRVGAYGYHLKDEGQKSLGWSQDKKVALNASEVEVTKALNELENCLIGQK